MNKELMKRKHMEESNVILQNRLNNKTSEQSFSNNIEKSNQRKDLLKDKLINQLKGK
jgi:ribosomal protein L31E